MKWQQQKELREVEQVKLDLQQRELICERRDATSQRIDERLRLHATEVEEDKLCNAKERTANMAQLRTRTLRYSLQTPTALFVHR